MPTAKNDKMTGEQLLELLERSPQEGKDGTMTFFYGTDGQTGADLAAAAVSITGRMHLRRIE